MFFSEGWLIKNDGSHGIVYMVATFGYNKAVVMSTVLENKKSWY